MVQDENNNDLVGMQLAPQKYIVKLIAPYDQEVLAYTNQM